MSDSRNRRSPYEQGELKTSPEMQKKKKSSKKSKKSHKLPPEARVHVRNDDDDDVQIIEAVDHGEEEGGSLTIKPPQAQMTRGKEKSHKHKKEKHRSRDHNLPKDRSRPEKAGNFHRNWKPSKDSSNTMHRDAREIVRERKRVREMKQKEYDREMKEKEFAREMKEKELAREMKEKEFARELKDKEFAREMKPKELIRDMKDKEARKREESIKERERLERMELEKRRDRQIKEGQLREEKQGQMREQKQRQRKDERFMDNHRDKTRKDFKSRSRDSSREQGQGRHFPPPPRLQDDKISKREQKRKPSLSPSRSPLRNEDERNRLTSDQDTRMVVVEDKDESGASDKSFEEIPERRKGSDAARKNDIQDPQDEEEDVEEESDDSDSDSDESDSESSSEEEESSDGEEEEEEKSLADTFKEDSKMEESSSAKMRSKFDDEESIGHSSHSEGEYMPDSPELSDVEMRPEDMLPPYLPAIKGCRSVEEFNCLNRIEEGTYGVVYRALDKKTNEIVALKRLKMEKEKEGFPITSLREINTLLKSQHENIVTVREIVVGSNMDKIYIVMDFVEHDLKSLMESMKNPFLVGEVKTLLKQLLRAVRHLHDNWILHRDLKTSNLLLSHQGILKVGDFGLAREYGSPLKHYTPVVVTLWYRAPELLLGIKEYSTHVDMWSVGCIFGEFLLMKALWPGKSEIDQLNRIFKDLGSPTETIWPGMSELPGAKKVTFNNHVYNVVRNRFGSYFTDLGFDLLNKLFAYDPSKRITAEDALMHDYFNESPLPVDPSMFPTWPARSEEGRKHASSPKPPSGGKAYQKLLDDEESFAARGYQMPANKGSTVVSSFSLKF